MKLCKRSHSFSLLEILICLVLLVGMGGFFSVRGYQLLAEKRSNAAMRTLVDELYCTRVLALTHQMDITITLRQEGSTILFERTTDFAPSSLKRHFDKPIKLTHLTLKDGPQKEIHFYSNGWIDDTNPILLYTQTKNHTLKKVDIESPRRYTTTEEPTSS